MEFPSGTKIKARTIELKKKYQADVGCDVEKSIKYQS